MARRGAAVRCPSLRLRLWLWLAAAPGARAIYAPTDPGDFILVEYTAVVPGVTESCAGDGCAAVFNCASPPWCAPAPRALRSPFARVPPAVSLSSRARGQRVPGAVHLHGAARGGAGLHHLPVRHHRGHRARSPALPPALPPHRGSSRALTRRGALADGHAVGWLGRRPLHPGAQLRRRYHRADRPAPRHLHGDALPRRRRVGGRRGRDFRRRGRGGAAAAALRLVQQLVDAPHGAPPLPPQPPTGPESGWVAWPRCTRRARRSSSAS